MLESRLVSTFLTYTLCAHVVRVRVYIGSIPIIGGSIPSIHVLTSVSGILLEPITQLVELRTFNPLVAGSNPARFIIALGVNPHHYLSDDT